MSLTEYSWTVYVTDRICHGPNTSEDNSIQGGMDLNKYILLIADDDNDDVVVIDDVTKGRLLLLLLLMMVMETTTMIMIGLLCNMCDIYFITHTEMYNGAYRQQLLRLIRPDMSHCMTYTIHYIYGPTLCSSF